VDHRAVGPWRGGTLERLEKGGGVNPTDEQAHIVDLFGTKESLAIEAGAGTGKTSTLQLLAESTGQRGQYVVFNKAAQTDAAARMPESLRCSTAHSLAFGAVGRRFAHRLGSGRMRSTEIAQRLGIQPMTVHYGTEAKTLSPGYLAGLAMRAVTVFCQTADAQPSPSHVPYIDGIDLPTGDGRRTSANNRAVAQALLPAMTAAWADLSDPDGDLPYKHDFYLKTWERSDPRVHVDYILADEAQDLSPVMLSILRQQDCQMAYVGDSNQAIYGWRGAVDALEVVDVEHRGQLSQSFRFGFAIAKMANRVLSVIPSDLRLKGLASLHSTIEEIDRPRAILCRTNAVAVERFLSALQHGQRPHLVGGGTEVVRFARAAVDLKEGRSTTHPELACFTSWGEVQTYVSDDPQGSELKLMVDLVDRFGAERIIRSLERMPREDAADLIVSTAHKSKGREWPSVKLADDFPDEPETEELRLLYVAVTRARQTLDVSNVEWLS
jgi:hypothetical protein